jgi:hypothetical protein
MIARHPRASLNEVLEWVCRSIRKEGLPDSVRTRRSANGRDARQSGKQRIKSAVRPQTRLQLPSSRAYIEMILSSKPSSRVSPWARSAVQRCRCGRSRRGSGMASTLLSIAWVRRRRFEFASRPLRDVRREPVFSAYSGARVPLRTMVSSFAWNASTTHQPQSVCSSQRVSYGPTWLHRHLSQARGPQR